MGLDIKVLGGFSVLIDGEEVSQASWGLKSARQIVKLLAITPRHRLHREQLIDALWPHLEVRSATNELNKALHAARRALEPSLAPRSSSRYLVSADRTVSISVAEPVRVDADEFERDARSALRCNDFASVEAAIDCYTGDLLPDDIYDEWTCERRDELLALHARLVLRASESAVEFKRAVAAVTSPGSAVPASDRSSAFAQTTIAKTSRPTAPRLNPWHRVVAAICCLLLCAGFTVEMVGASPRARHRIGRFLARTTAQLAGHSASDHRLVTLVGRVAVAGVRVDALDSVSGWAAITDANGSFTLIDVETRDDDKYDLVITDSGHARIVRVTGAVVSIGEALRDVGNVNVDSGRDVDPTEAFGINSESTLTTNDIEWAYLAGVFDAVTIGVRGDEARLLAVNDFVSARYSPIGAAAADQSARTTIDTGSSQSGPLARLMGAMCTAAGYDVRLLEIVDTTPGRKAHTIVEVSYGGGWHAFDPSFGIVIRNELGAVAGYEELRQNPRLFDSAPYARFRRPGWDGARIPGLFAAGIRHDSYFQNASKATIGPAFRRG